MKRLLAIASGKGGVGKTWFAISLGHALARMNRRVLLVDCDVGLANVDVQLGLDPALNLHHVFVGKVSIAQAVQSLDGLGFDVLTGRSGAGYLSGLDSPMVGLIQHALQRMGDTYDVVILDLPSGVEHGVRHLMRCADDQIIVTTGEPTALTDAYALIKATRGNGSHRVPRLICNLADHREAGCRTLEGLIRVCERFLAIRPSALGVIRRDGRVVDAISRQRSLLTCYPKSNAARDVIATAEALLAWTDRT
ncbi:MAG: MinD/ParA family protein [Rhizobiales bacterium]|nr:MinD/ParA family protein [Hyphomicrobiales bacterium]